MMLSSRLATAALLLASAIPTGAFVPAPSTTTTNSARRGDARGGTASRGGVLLPLRAEKSSPATTAISANVDDVLRRFEVHERIAVRDPTPEERGKGGVEVDDGGGGIGALEVLARIPRELVVSSVDAPARAAEAASAGRDPAWATRLTAATVAALHPTEGEIAATAAAARVRKEWIRSWKTGGWGTNADDLGPDISDSVTGTLLSTGSDNDRNIYAKFRMPCHPALLKASLGLEVLTGCAVDEAREALTARGSAYRGMRDALQELVLESAERPNEGTARDKRCWDVADTLSKVLSRATTLQLEDGDDATLAHAVVPVYERLAHSSDENSKLVSVGDEVLLVATRDIAAGEPITRDYSSAPRLANDQSARGSALHLLLQFGLPPDAWPAS